MSEKITYVYDSEEDDVVPSTKFFKKKAIQLKKELERQYPSIPKSNTNNGANKSVLTMDPGEFEKHCPEYCEMFGKPQWDS